MHIESVKSLFTIFTGETDYDAFMPIINLAVSETEKMLRTDADTEDVRLDFLCAAIANFRLVQIKSAKDRTLATAAGKVLNSENNSGTLKYAEKLMCDYISLCRDLIISDSFAFIGFGKGDEL